MKAIAAGYHHSLVLGRDGTVWVTGSNEYGQLGDGSRTPKTKFVRMISHGRVMDGAKAVAAGGWYSMVLRHDGRFWTSGQNDTGEVGHTSTTNKTTLFRVVQASDNGAWFVIGYV